MLQIGKEAVALLPAPLVDLGEPADTRLGSSVPWAAEICPIRVDRAG